MIDHVSAKQASCAASRNAAGPGEKLDIHPDIGSAQRGVLLAPRTFRVLPKVPDIRFAIVPLRGGSEIRWICIARTRHHNEVSSKCHRSLNGPFQCYTHYDYIIMSASRIVQRTVR
jgi:hypothetical protein